MPKISKNPLQKREKNIEISKRNLLQKFTLHQESY